MQDSDHSVGSNRGAAESCLVVGGLVAIYVEGVCPVLGERKSKAVLVLLLEDFCKTMQAYLFPVPG